MRLWSLHPSLLDAKGLVALWREGLLAQKVLEGRTRGYRHHPQLKRFDLASLRLYLLHVAAEADRRGYAFDRAKIGVARKKARKIPVTNAQMAYEWKHFLYHKLQNRDPELMRKLEAGIWVPHPSFRLVKGPIAEWERT